MSKPSAAPQPDLKKFIYDNGFSKRFYLCSCCEGKRLTQIPQGGFQPPKYKCEDCGELVMSPKWENIS